MRGQRPASKRVTVYARMTHWTLDAFCEKFGVNRKTLWSWRARAQSLDACLDALERRRKQAAHVAAVAAKLGMRRGAIHRRRQLGWSADELELVTRHKRRSHAERVAIAMAEGRAVDVAKRYGVLAAYVRQARSIMRKRLAVGKAA